MRRTASRKYAIRTVPSAFVLALTISVAACSGSGDEPLVEKTPVSTVDPTPSVTVGYDLPEGLRINGKDNDGAGEYSRVSLAEGSPVYTYNAAVVQPDAAATYSEAEITEAQRVAANFAVEEGVDSILVDADRTGEWYEQNAGKFTDERAVAVQEVMSQREAGSTLGGLVDNDVNGGRTAYDIVTDGGPRISALNMEKSNVFLVENGDVAIEFEGSVTRRAVNSSGEVGEEEMNFTQTYSLHNQGNGQWLISGWKNLYTYPDE